MGSPAEDGTQSPKRLQNMPQSEPTGGLGSWDILHQL